MGNRFLTRTTLTHPLQIATVAAGAGRIGVSFCPGKQQAIAAVRAGRGSRAIETRAQEAHVLGCCPLADAA